MKENAVIILNWNGEKLLKRFIPSVVKNTENADIYIIDNNSVDNSIQYLQENFPEIKIIKLDKNYGFAGGYNRGLKQINAQNLILLNSDVEVPENWLNPLIAFLESHPETAVIQPKIKSFQNKKQFEYAGAAGGFIDFFGYPYCLGRIFNKIEPDYGQYDTIKDIFWASGACFIIRKSVFEEMNGFDETYFAHQEEIDLCWRIKNKGYQIKYLPNSEVYHLGGGSLNNQSPFKTYLNFRNNLVTLLKNLPSFLLFPVIFSRLILDGLAGIAFLFQGKPKHTWAIIKAHFAFYQRIPQSWKKRCARPIKKYYHKFSIFLK